jgi:hypothetical protein
LSINGEEDPSWTYSGKSVAVKYGCTSDGRPVVVRVSAYVTGAVRHQMVTATPLRDYASDLECWSVGPFTTNKAKEDAAIS